MAIITRVIIILTIKERNKMKKIICLGFCVVILLSVTAYSAFAKLEISPSVELRENYTDNVLLSRTDREDDFITIITPSISLKYLRPFLDSSLDYGLNFRFYSRHSELNETDIRDTQYLSTQNQLRPLKWIFVDIFDVYQQVPIDVRDQIALENNFVNLTVSNIFAVSPHVEFPLSQTFVARLGYLFTDVWYKAEEGNDSNSHIAFGSLEKRLSQKFTTTLKYNYLAQTPEKTESYDRYEGSVAGAYRVTSKFQIYGEVGEAKFDFKKRKDSTITFWNIDAEYSTTEGTPEGIYRGISKDIPKGTFLGVSYGISFGGSGVIGTPSFIAADIKTTSISLGAFERRRFDLRFNTGRKLRIGINPYHIIDKYIEIDRKDKIIGATLDLKKPILRELTASAYILLEKLKFFPETEKVSRFSIDGGLDYTLSRRITTSIHYSYNSKNSDFDIKDFHSNVVGLKVLYTF